MMPCFCCPTHIYHLFAKTYMNNEVSRAEVGGFLSQNAKQKLF